MNYITDNEVMFSFFTRKGYTDQFNTYYLPKKIDRRVATVVEEIRADNELMHDFIIEHDLWNEYRRYLEKGILKGKEWPGYYTFLTAVSCDEHFLGPGSG